MPSPLRPLGPVDTVPLFEPLHEELIRLLRGLNDDDWEKPTVAGTWRVRDIVAHLLDGDLRVLSNLRDGYILPPNEPIENHRDLVGFLNRLNAEWVNAAERLSPRVLTDLLAATGPEVAKTFASLDPESPAPFAVDWAGESESKMWMHVGRDYTERWHHQAQIRDAVGAPQLLARRWFHPLLDLSMRALPRAYRDVEAKLGTCVVVEVEADGPDSGGIWTLRRNPSGWQIFGGEADSPAASIRVDADTAWKILYNALAPEEGRSQATDEGDEALSSAFFGTRSVMV